VTSIAAHGDRSSQGFRARLAAVAVTVGLLATAVAPAAAGAEAGSESPLGPSMSLAFARGQAKVVGTGALLSVKCRGPESGTCIGTVSLLAGGSAHKTPFSIGGGREQNIVVPLGSDGGRVTRGRVRALARTLQPLGACRETERVLSLR
jgi:hypothetical protein